MGKNKLCGEQLWYEMIFKKRKEDLIRLREKATPEEKAKIDLSLRFIEDLTKEEEPNECTVCELIDEEVDRLQDIAPFISLAEPIACSKPIDVPYRYHYFPKLTHDDFYGLIHDFFKDSLDRDLFKIFRGMFKKRKSYLYTERLMDMSPEPTTFFLPYGKKVFMRFKRRGNVDDLLDLSHEYGHGIQFLTNFHPNTFGENKVFAEVVSMFFELLAAEYFKSFEKFRVNLENLSLGVFEMLAGKADMVLFELDVLDIWKEKGYSTKQKIKAINDMVKACYNFDFLSLLDMDSTNDFIYIIGYLVGIELLMVYLEDKELGLYLLKQYMAIDLRLPKQEYYRRILNLGIKPNEHLSDYKTHIMRPIGDIK